MPSPIDPTNPPTATPPLYDGSLVVEGELPRGLTGRLVGVGSDGVAHSFRFVDGQVRYVARSLRLDVGVAALVAFDGSVLLCGDDGSIHQLDVEGGTLRRVDLAGQRRRVVACPRLDSSSGELHLVADDRDGAQVHVAVPAGALTRRSRQIVGAADGIHGFALGADWMVVVGTGVIGVAPRAGEADSVWMPIDVPTAWIVHTHWAGDTIVVLALTPSLERWVLHPGTGTVERHVLDATPRRAAHLGPVGVDGVPRWVWTAGDETIARHDLLGSPDVHHRLWPKVPGGFAVVADATNSAATDRYWFVGFVHDLVASTTTVRITEASDLAAEVAAVRLPLPLARELRSTWMPVTPD